MQESFRHYPLLAKRYLWIVVLGTVLCSGIAFVVSILLPPVYRASTTLIITMKSSTSAYDNFTTSELATLTYAQLVTDPTVLEPVVAEHQGMTQQQLSMMITAKPQSNTQLIELDVESNDPRLAMQLADQVGQSVAEFSNLQLPARIRVLPAKLPTDSIIPKPLSDTGLGAVVGLGLSLSLAVVFAWIDDRLTSPKDAQELLDMEILATIPRISRKQHLFRKKSQETSAWEDAYDLLYTNLEAAQTTKPFKFVMVTSGLAGEGKSTVAIQLASLLAKAGKNVLLVDANLRRPVLDQHFRLDDSQLRLSTLLQMQIMPEEALSGQATDIPTLRIFPTGTVSSHPTKMLRSSQFKQMFEYFKKASFDYIVFDAPPLLTVTDAEILALHVQAIVLVVDASQTPRKMLSDAKDLLKQTQPMLLGVVINKSPWSDHSGICQHLSYRQERKTENTAMMLPDIVSANRLTDETTTISLTDQQKNGDINL